METFNNDTKHDEMYKTHHKNRFSVIVKSPIDFESPGEKFCNNQRKYEEDDDSFEESELWDLVDESLRKDQDLINEIGVEFFKIGSGEFTDLMFIDKLIIK